MNVAFTEKQANKHQSDAFGWKGGLPVGREGKAIQYFLSSVLGLGQWGVQSVEGTVSFSLNDARHLWQPPSRQTRCPPEWQGFSEGPKAAGLQPTLEPLLAEVGRAGVGIQ